MESQVANLQNVAALSQSVHENFVGKVQPWIEFMGPTLALFNQAAPGDFELTGKEIVWARDLDFPTDAMSTAGQLPDTAYFEPIRFTMTPTQTYVRRAVDNFTVARARGNGTFEDYIGRVMRQLWDAFERAQNRHVHGSSNGYIGKVDGRTSPTVFTIKDGLGFTGMNPLMFIRAGTRIAWLDASNSYIVGGVGTVQSVAPSTKTVTMTASFENGASAGGAQMAGNDPIVLVTTATESATYFKSEYGLAPLGLLDHVDPLGTAAAYCGVSESAQPGIKTTRVTSSNFGEHEIMEWLQMISAKTGKPVTAQSHAITCQAAVTLALAKTLTPYTQIQQKGSTLQGGWTGVQIGQHEFFEDPFHVPDSAYALYREGLHTINLDGDPRLFNGDGSEWQRLADFDGKEVFGYHYGQRVVDNRNCFGALNGIPVTNADRFSADYIPV